MKKDDFIEIFNNYFLSKETFSYDNGIVKFKYKWYVEVYEYQPGWNAEIWNTKYTVSIIVDNESRHEIHKSENAYIDPFDMYMYSFQMQFRETRFKKYDEKFFSKLLENLEKLNIESKIKKYKYQKIKAIINGGHFPV